MKITNFFDEVNDGEIYNKEESKSLLMKGNIYKNIPSRKFERNYEKFVTSNKKPHPHEKLLMCRERLRNKLESRSLLK